MSLRSFALQKAIHARLSADAGIQAELGLPARIFDDPPPDAAFPYAVLGETRASRVPGHPSGVEHEIRIEIASRHAGRRDVKRVLDRLHDALHDADFAIEGARLVNIRFVFADVFRRDGPDVFTGVARFRAVTEAT